MIYRFCPFFIFFSRCKANVFFYSTKYYAIFLQISKLFRNFAAIVDISTSLTPKGLVVVNIILGKN